MNNKFLDQIKSVGNNFPWYNQIVKGIYDPTDIPILTREILDLKYYNQQQLGDLVRFTTSGTSSGKRRNIYYSQDEIDYNNNQKVDLFSSFVGSSNPVGVVVGIGLAAASAENVFKIIGKRTFTIRHNETLEKLHQVFKKERPEVLYTMPSLLDAIVDYISDKHILKSVKKIILVGEIFTEKARTKLAKIFEINENDILNTYGCVELGLLAYECNKCKRFHIMPNVIPELAELIDDKYKITNTKSGVLTITSLWRKNFPGVRYLTYDIVDDFNTIHCKSKIYNSFKLIRGRIGYEFKHGERISFYDIENSLLEVIPQAQFRIIVKYNQIFIELLNDSYSNEIVAKAEVYVNNAILEIGEMVANNFLNKIRILSISKKDFNGANWKKRVVFVYE